MMIVMMMIIMTVRTIPTLRRNFATLFKGPVWSPILSSSNLLSMLDDDDDDDKNSDDDYRDDSDITCKYQ